MKRFGLLSVLLALCATAAAAQAATGYTLIATGVTAASYSDASCPLQGSCYYQLTAVDSIGAESAPAACSSTQLCVGGNQAVVLMPSSGTHSVSLAWTASTTTGVKYNVYRHIGPVAASNFSATVN